MVKTKKLLFEGSGSRHRLSWLVVKTERRRRYVKLERSYSLPVPITVRIDDQRRDTSFSDSVNDTDQSKTTAYIDDSIWGRLGVILEKK